MEILLAFCGGTIIGFAVLAWVLNPNKEYPYSYHVAYSFEGEKGASGFGSMNVKRSQKINTSSDVTSVREFIEKENHFQKVVISNWIGLSN